MSEKIKTVVIEAKAKWSRNAYIEIIGKEVIFDTSDDEYGPIYFDLQLLEDKIKEHRERICERSL